MKYHKLGLLFAILIAGTLMVIPHQRVNAADISAIGIATFLDIQGSKIENGDIVIATSKGYYLSTDAYDPQVFGVVTDKPAIVLKSDAQQKGYSVITSGVTYVKVVNQNGNIKKGDFIATSAVTGAGMKASQNSYVLGEALDNASFTKPSEIKLIPVNMNLHYLQVSAPLKSSLLDIFTLSKIASYEQPTRVIQYITAAVIAIMSFAFGFIIFARAINTGLEALGRNPLAGRMIQLSIIFNVILVMIIIMTGIFLVYLVLHL